MDIKIKYVLKSYRTGSIINVYIPIETIENGLNNCFNQEHFEIIARCAYTGLKDKNGKEIYEGDIVKRTSMAPGGIDFVGKVVYEEYGYWLDNKVGAVSLFAEIDELEVIGNIYENPELLEV